MPDFRSDQTPVRQQGDRPTCVAFAVSAAHEWRAADSAIRSAEDALWAAHQVNEIPGLEATTVAWALQGMKDHGHAIEAAWPYGQPRWSTGRPEAATNADNRRRLTAWSEITPLTFETVERELRIERPVVLTLRVVLSAWHYGGGVVDAGPGETTPGNHAVLAVGTVDAGRQVIVKNSWGADWGDQGYGYVTERYLNSYALRAHLLEEE